MEMTAQTNISVSLPTPSECGAELEMAQEKNCLRNFQRDILPHLSTAHKLAHWLTRNEMDAQDVVQEAYLRALLYFGHFEGKHPRAWILKIVRNSSYTWLRQNRSRQITAEVDQDLFESNLPTANPLKNILRNNDLKLFQQALEKLSPPLREIFLLREFEGLSYKELSEVTGLPPGTVMSRLYRARADLRRILSAQSISGAPRRTH